jgi:hypothetical protein
VIYTCNPTLRRLRQEDHEFKASLDYLQDTGSKTKQKAILSLTGFEETSMI